MNAIEAAVAIFGSTPPVKPLTEADVQVYLNVSPADFNMSALQARAPDAAVRCRAFGDDPGAFIVGNVSDSRLNVYVWLIAGEHEPFPNAASPTTPAVSPVVPLVAAPVPAAAPVHATPPVHPSVSAPVATPAPAVAFATPTFFSPTPKGKGDKSNSFQRQRSMSSVRSRSVPAMTARMLASERWKAFNKAIQESFNKRNAEEIKGWKRRARKYRDGAYDDPENSNYAFGRLLLRLIEALENNSDQNNREWFQANFVTGLYPTHED